MSKPVKSFRSKVLGLLAGQLSRLGLQAAYFVVLARMLGASGYGAFALALALAALVSPFSSLGTNTLMLKRVSRDAATASIEWKRAACFTLIGGLILAGALTAAADLIAPPELSRLAIFLVAVSELVGLKLIEATGSVWQGQGRNRALIVLPIILNALRLIAAGGMFLVLGHATLDSWSVVYASVTLPLALAVAAHTTMKLGFSRGRLGLRADEAREGLLYSVALSSQNVYNDIDKAMLGNITSTGAAGVYSAAFRVVDMAYAPIRAISTATYPLYFRDGQDGLLSALRLTRKVFPAVLAVGVAAGLAAAFAAPFAPLVLGEDYQESVEIVRLLTPLIVLRGMTFLAADTLTGCGKQAFRTSVQIAVAVVNVGLNLVLIPPLAITGAVISTLACELLLATTLWIGIAWERRKERISAPQKETSPSAFSEV
jgi:O-antigen/teichoic acid export membrane protein